MNVIKIVTKLYDSDPYVQAFLTKVAKNIEGGTHPLKAFADESSSLAAFLSFNKAKAAAVVPAKKVVHKTSATKAAVAAKAAIKNLVKSVKAEALTVADGLPKPHRGRPTNAERAARLAAQANDQPQVIKVRDQVRSSGRGLPLVEDTPTAGEISGMLG